MTIHIGTLASEWGHSMHIVSVDDRKVSVHGKYIHVVDRSMSTTEPEMVDRSVSTLYN